jgi:small subunit ribosomal protein S17
MSEAQNQGEARNARRTEVGQVTSDKANKTIAVEVNRLVKAPKYGKFLRRTTRYQAHDEKREAHVGDTVEIMETRPISKTKRWRLVRVMKRGGEQDVVGQLADEKV